MLLFCAERKFIHYKRHAYPRGIYGGFTMQYEDFLLVDDVQTIKDHRCPYCDHAARILVDIETDTMPQPDDEGRLQYFCFNCGKIFTVEASHILIHS